MKKILACEFLPEHPVRWLVGVKFLAFLVMALVAFTPGNDVMSADVVFAQTEEVNLSTDSLFETQILEDVSVIPFITRTEFDEEKDKCDDPEITQEGRNGSKTKQTLVTYYRGEEYTRQVMDTVIVDPVDQVTVQGQKKIYKTMETDSGTIRYWCKLGEFTATAYDPTCLGCSATTAIGMRAGFGVVAVDPKVIPLRSDLYITGYGRAVAGDTGGAIKGKRVDLGFDSIGAWWGRRTVEVYML